MWHPTRTIRINGRRKWRTKNRCSVASLTAKPPQTHSTMLFPMIGIADRRLVITVAAHKLIWPQTSTYPMNAVAISTKMIIIPTIHVAIRR